MNGGREDYERTKAYYVRKCKRGIYIVREAKKILQEVRKIVDSNPPNNRSKEVKDHLRECWEWFEMHEKISESEGQGDKGMRELGKYVNDVNVDTLIKRLSRILTDVRFDLLSKKVIELRQVMRDCELADVRVYSEEEVAKARNYHDDVARWNSMGRLFVEHMKYRPGGEEYNRLKDVYSKQKRQRIARAVVEYARAQRAQ